MSFEGGTKLNIASRKSAEKAGADLFTSNSETITNCYAAKMCMCV